jgi:hypothetical protein
MAKSGKKEEKRTFEDVVSWLKAHEYDLLEPQGVSNRVFVKKYGCSAALEKTEEGGVRIFAYPGYLIGGEIAKLVNRGYQQVLKTTKTEVAATADHLKALHQFTEELKEAMGVPSLYNESLGTVASTYEYDRIVNRDKPASERPTRAWEKKRA